MFTILFAFLLRTADFAFSFFFPYLLHLLHSLTLQSSSQILTCRIYLSYTWSKVELLVYLLIILKTIRQSPLLVKPHLQCIIYFRPRWGGLLGISENFSSTLKNAIYLSTRFCLNIDDFCKSVLHLWLPMSRVDLRLATFLELVINHWSSTSALLHSILIFQCAIISSFLVKVPLGFEIFVNPSL